MKVLHLPVNIASQVSITVRALRDIGVDARGLVLNNNAIQESEDLETFEVVSRRRHPVRGFIQSLPWWYAVQSAIRWADVVHWHFGAAGLPRYLDLQWARLLNKPGVVEFWGSDIRIAEIESQDNPYYAEARRRGQYQIPDQRANSRKRQLHFAKAGFECIIGRLMQPYIQPDLFPESKLHFVLGRVFLPDYPPRYPSAKQARPVIAHSPSRPLEKGTPAVLAAVEMLRERFDFEFHQITGITHSRAVQMVSECDIFVDQLISGMHGVAALEAMALGKPVVCYIKPSVISQYPPDFPIVNANQDNLAQVLGSLLEDEQRRHEIGRQSRAYVEKYHDAHQIARQLVSIYQELIDKTRRGSKKD